MNKQKIITAICLALCFSYINPTEVIDIAIEADGDAIAEVEDTIEILFKPTTAADMCPIKTCRPSLVTKKFELEYYLKQFEMGDLDVYIQLMCQITGKQRQIIDKFFFNRFGMNISDKIKMRGPLFTANLKMALKRLRMKPEQIFAEDIHYSLHKYWVNIERITEILFTISNYGLLKITEAYGDMYGRSLPHEIKECIRRKPLVRNLLTLRAEVGRQEILEVDEEKAIADAIFIFDHRASKTQNWQAYFNTVIVTDSADQLHLLFHEFDRRYGKIENFIEKYARSEIEDTYKAIVAMTRNPYDYLARRMYSNLKGLGTRDRDLMRIVIGRGEMDLADIEDAFDALPEVVARETNLRKMIKGDIHLSRYYARILTSILSARATNKPVYL